MNKVYIVSGCRTPIGVMGGAFKTMMAAQLGSIAVKEAVKRAGIAPEQVDEVFMGCGVQAGQKPNVARQCSIGAGLPVTVPATTVNVLCGSGLHSINLAAKQIAGGYADVIVAGGTESMSTAPYLVLNGRFGYRLGPGKLEDSLQYDALNDAFYGYHMGVTAENVADQWNLTRQQMDELAAESQRRAVEARDSGRFDAEIVPVEVKTRKGTVIVDKDEGPRPGTTVEVLSKLKAVFRKENGRVTAGNASGINDGASAIVLMSEAKVKELGITPMAEWLGGDLGGVDPSIMGTGPIVSTNKLLKKLGLTVNDMDLIEANEAFAAQTLAVAHDLGFDMSKVNVNGGAIALGHPLGDSGCRILVTLLYEMQRRDAKKGLATLCIGGGMGCSAVVERP